MRVEIFILNYNGRDLLEACLPSVITASKKSIYSPEVIVVDNCSTDGSKDFVLNNFNGVKFREMKENRVLCSFNIIAEESSADTVIFLNNDLVVDENFIDPLVGIFLQNNKAFLAAARVYNFDGSDLEEGRTKPVIEWGIVKAVSKYEGYERDLENISYNFQAGFGAFDRKKFLELDGYDPLFLPGIAEDMDICFRAWKRGYYCYYQPASHIYHMGKASFTKRFGSRKLLAISHRNTYFFIWKNIADRRILAMNLLFALPRMLYALVMFKWEIVQGFLWFLSNLPEVIEKRRQEQVKNKFRVMTDMEIFRMFK